MVKKVKKANKDEAAEENAEEVKAVEAGGLEEKELYESDLVKLKKENQKQMEKQIKKMDAEIKEKIDLKQVSSGVKALQKYFKQQRQVSMKKQLLDDEDSYVHLSFTLGQVPNQPTPRPMQVEVPKPFYSKDHDTRVCFIVKDPESEFKKIIADLDIPCVADVIGFDRLRREYREFKDKRQLIRDYDFFLADIRVYKMLPECLGKEFYAKKAFPCPIKVHGFDSPEELQKQLNHATEQCVYYTQGNGPNYTVKIGRISQDAKDIAKNFQSCFSQVLGYTTCWDDISFEKISQITLRVGNSIELPVYNHFDQADIDAYMNQQ